MRGAAGGAARRRRRARGEKTRGAVLRAAEEVFAARGFEGASTREIAARAGVNISSLHYHWESKETLYFAVFENIYDRIVDLVRSSIPEASMERSASGRAAAEMALTGHAPEWMPQEIFSPKRFFANQDAK